MSKTNYKEECKRQKEQIVELEKQISTLKERQIILRKAKNQTILKTAIVNRAIFEPQFDNYNTDNAPPPKETIECGTNTDKPPTPPPPPPPPREPSPPKRMQRKRVKENWSQCKIYTANKITQVQFVQTCHCEGVPEESSASDLKSKAPSPVSFPKISTPSNAVSSGGRPTPSPPEIRTISRMKTKDYISSDAHDAEIKAIQIVSFSFILIFFKRFCNFELLKIC